MCTVAAVGPAATHVPPAAVTARPHTGGRQPPPTITTPAFAQPNPTVLQRFPNNSTRQRLSNVAVSDPEKEFNKTSLDSCRSTIVQQEADLKVLRESLDMRTKRVMQLESQVGIAASLISSRDSNPPQADADRASSFRDSLDLLHRKIDTLSSLTHTKVPCVNVYNNAGNYEPQRSSKASQTMPVPPSNHDQAIPSETDNDEATNIDAEAEDTVTVFTCTICNENAESSAHLDRHLEVTHGQAPGLVKSANKGGNYQQDDCDYCDATFQAKGELQEHISVNHPTSYLQCSKCMFRFQTKHQLSAHMKECHEREPEPSRPRSASVDPSQASLRSLSSSKSSAATHSESL